MLAVVAARLMPQTLPPGAACVTSPFSSFLQWWRQSRPLLCCVGGVLIAPPLQLAPSIIENADARLALRENVRFLIAGVSFRAHLERRFFKDNPFFFFFFC